MCTYTDSALQHRHLAVLQLRSYSGQQPREVSLLTMPTSTHITALCTGGTACTVEELEKIAADMYVPYCRRSLLLYTSYLPICQT